MADTNVDILAPDRFEELDAKLAEIDAALDDPDSVSGGHANAFILALQELFREGLTICEQLTPQDFEATYTDEGGEDDEESEQDGLGGLGL